MSLNKILAALLVVVFVIFTLVAIVIWSLETRVLDADAYVQALDGADFFELPYQLIRRGDVPRAGDLLLLEGPLSVAVGDDLEAVARELAPPAWLRAQLTRAIRDLLAVAGASELEELPGLTLSLQEVKARALGEPGDRALDIVVAALPECPPGQSPLDPNRAIPLCRPAGADLAPLMSQLKAALVPLVERVPDTYQVRWQPEQQDALEALQRTGRDLERSRVALLLLVALNLALLGLIWLLAVRSPREWLRWTGGPLSLLGLLTLLLALAVPRAVDWGLANSALTTAGDVPPAVVEAVVEAFVNLAVILFRPAQRAGVILVVAGLLLLLISPLLPGRRRRARAGVPDPPAGYQRRS